MNKITINFEDLTNELKYKNLRIFIRKTNDTNMFIQDKQDNIYQIENYFAGSYLDRMINNKIHAEFIKVDKNIIKDYEKDYLN